jgi:hypothetical protein
VQSGRYDLTLEVPAGTPPRVVRAGGNTFTVRPGPARHLAVATDGSPLRLYVDVPNAPLGGRVLGVQVLSLRFTPARRP